MMTLWTERIMTLPRALNFTVFCGTVAAMMVVEILWTNGANPVENPPTKIFILPDHARNTGNSACGQGLRGALRLIACHVGVKSTAFTTLSNTSIPDSTL
jgi:hypothetical protein